MRQEPEDGRQKTEDGRREKRNLEDGQKKPGGLHCS